MAVCRGWHTQDGVISRSLEETTNPVQCPFLWVVQNAKYNQAVFFLGINEKQRQKWALFTLHGLATPKEMQLAVTLFVLEDGCEEALSTTVKVANQCVISTVLALPWVVWKRWPRASEGGLGWILGCAQHSSEYQNLKKRFTFRKVMGFGFGRRGLWRSYFYFLKLIKYVFYIFSKIKWLEKVHWKLVAELEN